MAAPNARTEASASTLAEASGPATAEVSPLLEVVGASKRYGPVLALDDVDFDLRAGEIHGLCGHNGAGKSTLVRLLSGLAEPDSGTLRIGGQEATISSPVESGRLGIAVVEQELAQVPALSVADNVFLGHPDTPWLYRRQRAAARQYLDQVGLHEVDADAPLGELRLGQRQLVEIARLLARDARILILDEPTATLGAAEIERVFAVVQSLVSQGCGAIFVTHRLGEVFDYCDRVTVIREGRRIATRRIAELQRSELVRLMVDHEPVRLRPSGDARGEADTRLELERISVPGAVRDVSLHAGRGQIVALAGQVGAGAPELLRAVAGLDPTASGRVLLDGREIRMGDRGRVARAGVAYVPEDRAADGLFFGRDASENLTAGSLARLTRGPLLTRRAIVARARALAGQAHYDEARLGASPETLSGGNQQKLLVGRALEGADGLGVVLLSEPTRGVDIQSRTEIYDVLRAVSETGTTVLVASTDLEEIVELADVVYTMFSGRIVARYSREQVTARQILADMTHDEGHGSALVDDAAAAEAPITAAEVAVAADVPLAPAPPAAPAAASAAPVPAARSPRREPRWWVPRVVAVVAVAAVAIAAASTSGFFSTPNFHAILTAVAVTGILSVGLTPIMISGNYFSLSLGVTLVSCSMLFLTALQLGVVPAVLISLGLGVAIGFLQGAVIGGLRTDPIITTIAFATLASGVAIWLTGGNAVSPKTTSTAYRALVETKLLGISMETLVFVVVAVGVAVLLRWTRWGREVYLLGSSDAAARTSGISTTRVVIGAFALAGLCAGLAGVLRGADTSSATLGFTSTYDFDAITAVLVGGTLITGGRGSVGRTVIGVVALAVLSDVLLLRGAELQTQILVKGLIVLCVVALTGWLRLASTKD